MNTNDLVVGLDPTGLSNISGAQLAQMVNGATPSSDRGMVLITTDSAGVPIIPDAAGTVEWQRYLWIRLSPLTTSFTVCAWNPAQTYNMGYSNGSGTTVSTNWNPVSSGSIPAGSIQGYQISSGTITKDKIVSVDLSQVNGSASLLTTASALTGDVTGTIGATVIGANAVTSTKLANDAAVDANRAVTTNSIKVGAVTPAKIAASGVVNSVLTDVTGTTPAWTVAPIIAGLPTPNAGGSDDGKLVAVNSGAAGTYKYLAGHIILQTINVITTSVVAHSGSLTNTTSTPNYNSTGLTPAFNSGLITKLDTTGKSKLKISVKVSIWSNTFAFVGLYNATGAVAPIAGSCVGPSSTGAISVADFVYYTGANPTDATYYIGFGVVTSGSAHAYVNSTDGTNNPFLITQSSITIEEIL